MKNKVLSALLVLALLAACAPATATQPAPKRVVYLINGALGDNAFYDSGKQGIDAIAQRYGVSTSTIECNFDVAKCDQGLKDAIKVADVIFVISYGFEDQLKAVADANPDKIFVNLDTIVRNDKNTITSVDYIEEEAAYLAGVTAALATTDTSIKNINPDKIIGAVGGDMDVVIRAFVFAYENGARSVDPEIKVEVKSLNGVWDDPAKGKEAALQLFDQRADVVFQIAAASGLGVLQAAKERQLYAIGVDTNQNDIEPGFVIGSMIKNVGKSIEDVYATIADGTYRP
ncbi:MAG: BMP family ABC transporter substrate-binding protein, partial [Anaerolineales bacterium]|nr:BMP family ABC transporter substrate-binding protein [Anaerolineales bacterium]